MFSSRILYVLGEHLNHYIIELKDMQGCHKNLPIQICGGTCCGGSLCLRVACDLWKFIIFSRRKVQKSNVYDVDILRSTEDLKIRGSFEYKPQVSQGLGVPF